MHNTPMLYGLLSLYILVLLLQNCFLPIKKNVKLPDHDCNLD